MPDPTPPSVLSIDDFIARWKGSSASERSNYALFLSELCDQLGVARPDPASGIPARDAYVIDRTITFTESTGQATTNYIDLYKRGGFVLVAKQGSHEEDGPDAIEAKSLGAKPAKRRHGTARRGTRGWDTAIFAARAQAERYVRALPPEEGNPPFIIVTDVGHSFDLYSDFSRSGKNYVPFPDARSNRIMLDELADPAKQEWLRAVWADPMSLDPARRSAAVTRDVANRLALLAKSLEQSGHAPADVASFLMRSIFTMFAEDIGLLPDRGFLELLESLRGPELPNFAPMVSGLWATMAAGGFSQIIRRNVLRFNGGLFESATALNLTGQQLDLLIEAARADWHDVEPAIFGTLLERALDPRERHKLGAHFTPRSYVERLVLPTIIEPLREEWDAVKVAATALEGAKKPNEAAEEVFAFHRKLCTIRVLDPACGSGNFLYVTLEHLKRLEGEVLEALAGLSREVLEFDQERYTVDPHQLLGIELNPRAAAIADLVIWIGYLQWHFRTRGQVMPREPVLKKFRNIECRDAVLAYDSVEPVLDADGRPVTRWDGHTMKVHPVTGKEVPDDAARVPVYNYVNPRKAEWPEADYIVGNPPFIGGSVMRSILGEGYVETLRRIYKDLPDSIDYVMYWWDHAAQQTAIRSIIQFGFISTNSLRQTYNRRVLSRHLQSTTPISLIYTVPDHPWIESTDGADVRISITVATAGQKDGFLEIISDKIGLESTVDTPIYKGDYGTISASLSLGISIDKAQSLLANSGISSRGMQLISSGFIVSPSEDIWGTKLQAAA
ncbi:MAG: methyltransferase [Chlorobi bacterium]|nr:methyltransferase [Chlorobiota bacterium]